MSTIIYCLRSLWLSRRIYLKQKHTRIMCWLKYATKLNLTEIAFHPGKYGILLNDIKGKNEGNQRTDELIQGWGE